MLKEDISLGRRLYYELGWSQGAVFRLDGACVLRNARDAESGVTSQASRPCDADEVLILASQDCDIVADDEPSVEVLVCSTDIPKDKMRNVLRDSARNYVVDWELGIVADARLRLIIEKELLLSATRETVDLPPVAKEDFADWLAWRFTRPAIDDELVHDVQSPLRDARSKLEKAPNDVAARLNEIVKDARIKYPGSDDSTVHLVFILHDIEPTADHANAIERAIEIFGAAVEKKGKYSLHVDVIPYSEVLLRTFEATQPFRLGYLTRWGEELIEPSGVLRNL